MTQNAPKSCRFRCEVPKGTSHYQLSHGGLFWVSPVNTILTLLLSRFQLDNISNKNERRWKKNKILDDNGEHDPTKDETLSPALIGFSEPENSSDEYNDDS